MPAPAPHTRTRTHTNAHTHERAHTRCGDRKVVDVMPLLPTSLLHSHLSPSCVRAPSLSISISLFPLFSLSLSPSLPISLSPSLPLQMLSTRKFLKWRERHWVNFHFDDRGRDSVPTFVFPTKFSIRMQEVGSEVSGRARIGGRDGGREGGSKEGRKGKRESRGGGRIWVIDGLAG